MTGRGNDARTLVVIALMSVWMAREADAQKGVMLMNRIGPTRSTLFASNDDQAALSPNGSKVAFVSTRITVDATRPAATA